MKKLFFLNLIILISIYPASAQKTININNTSYKQYEEIEVSKDNKFEFKEAKRLRKIAVNEYVKTNTQISLGDTIELDLFSNKQYKASVIKVDNNTNGTFLVSAKLVDYESAYCFISTYEGKSLIMVDIPENNELYKSRYNRDSGTNYLLEIDKSKDLIDCHMDGVHDDHKHSIKNEFENDNISNSPPNTRSSTTLDTIKLLVVYTPNAAAWSAANEISINNTISLMMANTALVYSNSGTLLDIQLVHSQEVAYTELQSVQDLHNLRATSDGIMDTVHALRDLYCADLVTLLEETSHTGGTAYLLSNTNGSPANGFSILRVQQASWSYTAAHEFAHNLGCGHHKDQNFQAGPGIFTYSAGGRWVSTNPTGNYCSVMSYTNGSYYADGITHSRVPYFSNPTINYLGTATGDSLDADNARSIRETKTAVAGYRNGCSPPSPVSVSGDGGTFCDSVILVASGGTGGTIYWQGTTSGGTSTSTPSTSQTVTSSGTYYFRANNLHGWSLQDSATVIIDSLPSQGGTISGVATICQGQSETYTISPITNASSYVWTLPSGVIGSDSTTSITVNFSDSAVSGNITVMGNNFCGDGPASSLSIVVDPLPGSAETISGATTVCHGQTETYTVPLIANATSYIWTLPTGVIGSSTSNSIDLNFSNTAISGNITVIGNNLCGDGSSSTLPIVVNPIPPTPVISNVGSLLTSDASNGNQWHDQNGPINGETDQNFTATIDGNYYVIVTLLGCVSDTSNVISISFAEIKDTPNNPAIRIFPNPVSDELFIEFNGNDEKITLEIVNPLGQVVYSDYLVTNMTITTTDFAAGTYLIKLTGETIFETRQMIKE